MLERQKRMTNQEFAIRHELLSVDVRGPGLRSDRKFLVIVVRAVIGMANQRDGGKVIIGNKECDSFLDPVGLLDELKTL